MKILHAADLHLDTPFTGHSERALERLQKSLSKVPEMLANLCRQHGCDMMLLAGDIFDGEPTAEGTRILRNALEEVKIPVFITPGNHDFCTPASPWLLQVWPENVHIFTQPHVESVALPELDCRVYGAAFTAMDCPALLKNFRAEGTETYHIGIFHGDPTQKNSPYNPISQAQVAASGLQYLALGHVHKAGQFTAGGTLCLWPGCPMGRGNDETGEKGVYIVTIEDKAEATFVPLDVPRFYDLEAEVLTDPRDTVRSLLPAVGNEDFYRITLTGQCQPFDAEALTFTEFPNLQVRDRTEPPADLWGSMHDDSLEGLYFRLLHEALAGSDPETVELAAKISRRILDGREVSLP